jgi:hypothetical protein
VAFSCSPTNERPLAEENARLRGEGWWSILCLYGKRREDDQHNHDDDDADADADDDADDDKDLNYVQAGPPRKTPLQPCPCPPPTEKLRRSDLAAAKAMERALREILAGIKVGKPSI